MQCKRDNSRADLNPLQQFVYLIIRHLLSQLRQDISQLSSTDEPVPFFVEYLEPTDELL